MWSRSVSARVTRGFFHRLVPACKVIVLLAGLFWSIPAQAQLLSPTTTTVTASTTTPSFGSSVTFTATVTSGAGTPNGTVVFLADLLSLGSATLNASGQATFTTSSLGIGVHSVVAVYLGNLNYLTSTAIALNINVSLAVCTINVSASATLVLLGASVNLTATVNSPGGTPTGILTFRSGLNVIGTATLNGGGQGALTLTTSLVGLLSIGIDYSGDATHLPCTAPIIIITVNQGPTTTAVSPSANPSIAGNPVIFTAVVTGSGATPTGSVTFRDGAATIGTGTLNGSGQASFSTSGLAAGSHSITAVYAGDANFTGSTSPTLVQQVNQGSALSSSTTALTVSPNPAASGTTVTFTAQVSTGSGTPTGTVTFRDGGTPVGTVAVNGAGTATFTTNSLTAGSHSITATYGGDATYTGSTSSPVALVVNGGGGGGGSISTNTTLSSSANPAVFGQPLTFTASVTASAGTPTGLVTFRNGGQAIGSVQLAGGSATLVAASLGVGSHSITAVYAGNATFASSTSSPLAQSMAVPHDSVKLKKLQVVASRIAAQNSGQAIAGTIDAAIEEGFAAGDQMIAPSELGLRLTSGANDPRRPAPDFVLWSELRHTSMNPDGGRSDIGGNQTNAFAGLTVRIVPDLIAGIFGGYESFGYDVASLSGRLRGDGVTGGAYVGWRFLPGVRLDAGIAQSGVGYTGIAGTAIGSFNGARTLLTAGIAGTYNVTPALAIEPSARVFGLWETQSAYTDSLGIAQADRSFATARVSAGAKAVYRWLSPYGLMIAPYAGAYADSYFNRDDGVILASPISVMEGTSARVIGGVAITANSGMRLTAGGEVGGIGGNFTTWSFRTRGSVPF